MSAYIDPMEFLEDAQKLPCKIKFDIPNSGHLEGTAEKHLREGTTLELPFWLAATLSAKDMVDIFTPRPYNSRVRNALSASAESVNLRNLGGGGGAFYAGGTRLTSLTDIDGLTDSLHNAFRERLVQVMDQSQHTSADSGGEGAAYEFCQGLDIWERELFLRGETSAKEVKAWSEIKSSSSSKR
ncbi:hypothetical protein T439DRAFT_327880 [Meredithblackwellia eburnea MCA 4105]